MLLHSQGEASFQKITVNVPDELLNQALEVTGGGITQTVREGLERIARSHVYEQFAQLRGSSKIELDIASLREDRELL